MSSVDKAPPILIMTSRVQQFQSANIYDDHDVVNWKKYIPICLHCIVFHFKPCLIPKSIISLSNGMNTNKYGYRGLHMA